MLLSKVVYDTGKKTEDLGIQCVYTPLDEIEKATGFSFNNAVSKDTKEICVMFNPEFVEYFLNQDYIKNNSIKIIFCFDSEFDRNWVNRIGRFYKYNNIEYINFTKFSKTKNIKDLIKSMGQRKFDVVFSNPPYDGNLHLKILKELFNCSENIIFVHPASYILDNKFKKKLYNEVRNTNYLESINLFWGNKMFNIKLFMPLCISVWNMNKKDNICKVSDNAITKSEYITEINNISVHGKFFKDIFNNIKSYINKHKGSIQDNVTNENKLTDYSVRFSLIQGTSHIVDKYSDDFFNLTGKHVKKNYCDHTFRLSESEKSHTGNGKNFPLWTFNNEIERENFIQYCKSKIVRFCLSLYKINANIYAGELELIPWLDFTKFWDDAKLCKEFNISEELWQYIDKFIPDYYDDYKSGFEKE